MAEQFIELQEDYHYGHISKEKRESLYLAESTTENDIKIEHAVWPSMRMSAQRVRDHVVMFNMGAPLNFTWHSQHNYHALCDTGSVVELISNTARDEMHWTGEYHTLRLTFGNALLDRLVGMQDFNFVLQRNIDDPFLREIGFKIYEKVHAGVATEKVYVDSLCVACVIHLVSRYSGKKVFAPKGKLSAGQLLTVVDYIRTRIHSNITLEALASTVHLSVFHFSRLFKHTLEVSPYHFVLQLKIEQAKKLIREYGGGISDVAYMLNFTDQAHFSNAFKKITGLSPRQFWIGQNRMSVL